MHANTFIGKIARMWRGMSKINVR